MACSLRSPAFRSLAAIFGARSRSRSCSSPTSIYSLQYLARRYRERARGVNAQNLWGIWTIVFSLLAVGTFFWLGYQYLGSRRDGAAARCPRANPPEKRAYAQEDEFGARHWYDPREGLAAMRWPLDYAIAAALGVGNFILSFVGYWWPPDKVFDEIYFARAGEEYLQNLRIYENTHPPLSKLLITISIALFGGMPKGHGLGGWTGLNAIVGHLANGDNSYGWRFLDVVFGALVVMLLYAFAKRVTGSTLFATVAALLLTFDGMHFVQSRIATPEGFVVFFATLAVYAFYRFWISSQVGERAYVATPLWAIFAGAGASVVAGGVVGQILRVAFAVDAASTTVTTLYLACACYLLVRYLAFPRMFADGRRELTFAEGSYALRGGVATVVHARRRRHDRRPRQDCTRSRFGSERRRSRLRRRSSANRVPTRFQRNLRDARWRSGLCRRRDSSRRRN